MLKIILILLSTSPLYANFDNLDYDHSTEMSPSDYLFGSHGKKKDPVFDEFRTVDLDIDLGIGSDCGKINYSKTMRAALKNILDTKYLGDMGKDILAASPMLLTCYFSPTWCSILKQFRLRANLVGSMRLDQCRFINKYVDSRTEDFEKERQECVNKEIEKNDGNMEAAMETCKNYWDVDIADWSGGNKSGENRLIDSTAKWAGLNTSEAKEVISLTKALVGDTIIKQGKVSVDYGPRRLQLTPRTYIQQSQALAYDKLCNGLVERVVRYGPKINIHRVVKDDDLMEISQNLGQQVIDRQTIRSLSLMPPTQRQIACRKLSDAIGLTIAANNLEKSLDFMAAKVGTNPHLSKFGKTEGSRKTKALKDQIELALTLYKEKNEPLNNVLRKINEEGLSYQSQITKGKLKTDEANNINRSTESMYMDCGDDIFCN